MVQERLLVILVWHVLVAWGGRFTRKWERKKRRQQINWFSKNWAEEEGGYRSSWETWSYLEVNRCNTHAKGTCFSGYGAQWMFTCWLNCSPPLANTHIHTHTHTHTHFLDSLIRIFITCHAAIDPSFENQALSNK